MPVKSGVATSLNLPDQYRQTSVPLIAIHYWRCDESIEILLGVAACETLLAKLNDSETCQPFFPLLLAQGLQIDSHQRNAQLMLLRTFQGKTDSLHPLVNSA